MQRIIATAGKKMLARGITVGTAIWKTIQKELKSFWKNIFEEGLSNFTAWYTEEYIDHWLESFE